ncbi:hypothetical protein M407DRAFT_81884, partial [Tulasnella calospora MUT 4182]
MFESIRKFFREQEVAIKKLEWPRDDVEESTKFFKVLFDSYSPSIGNLNASYQSFVNELSLMASLSHPNIIQFLGFVEDTTKGDAWIILPWESNGNVREFLKSGEWDIPERISLIQDAAKGLLYLHTHDPPICHGDLKSLNILVNSSYQAIITDFGSARIRRNVASDNGSETPCQYSLRWTAPEVLDDGTQDLPSDMWALGWIVTGRLPFDELNKETAVIIHTMKGKLPAIRNDTRLSHVLMLCGLMSDCWLFQPPKRINASMF